MGVIKGRRSERDPVGLVVGGLLGLVVFGLSWLRHTRFWSGFDLAIFDQAAWQISEGRDHISIVDRHVLADHFSPVLYPLGLLYRLVPSPSWLLGAQAIALGATVIPMRGVARVLGASPIAATGLVAASAPLLAAGLFDFHPGTLAVPFIALTLLWALQDRPGLALLGAALVAGCRADLGLVLVAVAIVAGPRTRLPLGSAGVVIAAFGSLLPSRFGESNGWTPHFGHLGDSPVQAVLHPWDVVGQLLSSGSLSVLLVWIVAAGGLVVLQPRWMLALVVAGLPVLLSRWEGTALPWYHYGAPMAPLAIGGTLAALGSGLEERQQRLRIATWLGPIVALVLASPLSPAAPERTRVWAWSDEDSAVLSALVEEVADHERVTADQRLLPHLAHREELLVYPLPFHEADSFFATGSGPVVPPRPQDLVDVVIATNDVLGVVPDGDYETVRSEGGWSLLRRLEEP